MILWINIFLYNLRDNERNVLFFWKVLEINFLNFLKFFLLLSMYLDRSIDLQLSSIGVRIIL